MGALMVSHILSSTRGGLLRARVKGQREEPLSTPHPLLVEMRAEWDMGWESWRFKSCGSNRHLHLIRFMFHILSLLFPFSILAN